MEGRPAVAPTWDVGRAKGGVGTPGRRLRDGRVCLVVAGVLVSHDATTEKIPAISWSGRSSCGELPVGGFSDAGRTLEMPRHRNLRGPRLHLWSRSTSLDHVISGT